MCKQKTKVAPFKHQLTEQIISGYINFLDSLKEFKDIINVNMSSKNDTSILDIANTYPVLENNYFNGLEIIDNSKVAFTGERISGHYREIDTSKIPNDIKLVNKKEWPLYKDFRLWSFHFKKDSLIYYEPKSDIDKFIKINQY